MIDELIRGSLVTDPIFIVSAANAQGVLEEIVVTARKREESLQDTPISVTAFTGDTLEAQHIDNLDAIASFTPNMEFDSSSTFSGSSGAGSIFIRGIGQVDFTLTTEPGVGVYLDGVYVSTSIGSVLDLVDIETIEVLRGPQGTLFGRNTIGGAINVRSRRPDETLHGNVQVTGGAYNRIDGKASVNVPLTDNLFGKASFATFNRDGFLSAPNTPSGDDLGDINRDTGRIALRWVPTDRFEANFSADYTRVREEGVPHILNQTFEGESLALIAALATPTSPAFVPPPAPLPPPGFVDLFNIKTVAPIPEDGMFGVSPPNRDFGMPTITSANVQQVDGGANFSDMDLQSESDVWGVSLDLEYDFGWATVRSITSYREMEAFTIHDQDGLPITVNSLVNTYDHEQISEELQLSGLAFDDRLNWLLGFYHFEEEGINLDEVEFPPVHILSGANIDNRSTAGFAQFTFDVTEKIAVTAGIRYTDEKKKYIVDDECHPLPDGPATLFDGTVVPCTPIQTVIDPKTLTPEFLAIVSAPVFPAPGGRVCCLPISDASGAVVALIPGLASGDEVLPRGTTTSKFDDWTPHASISYNFHDDLMVYFSYSEGFKSGGFVQRVFPPKTEVPIFGVESATVYEGGVKWTGLDNRVRVSAAGFHTDYDDLQVQINDGIAPVTRNAAAAEIDGFEFEMMALPADGWLLQAGVGFLDASYQELSANENFATDIRAITLDTNLVNAPDWSTSVGLQYEHNFSNGGTLLTRLDWRFRTEVNKDALNFPSLTQDDLHLLDAVITYTAPGGNWDISAFGKNMTDERYIVSGFSNALTQGTSSVNIGRPAEWGMSVRYRFGE